MGRAEFGNAIYFTLFLQWFYDTLVLGFICPRAWGCPEDVLQGHYSKHVSSLSAVPRPRLLDIGVGTGHFIEHAPLAPATTVFLADINENPLAEARGRIKRTHKDVDVNVVLADVFDLGEDKTSSSARLSDAGGNGSFDVISCMLLLHCLPGEGRRKGEAIARLCRLLKPGGAVVGATVLGSGVKHNTFGRLLMSVYNFSGVFHNEGDSTSDIIQPLEAAFEKVEFRVVGTTLLFEAKSPRTPGVAFNF